MNNEHKARSNQTERRFGRYLSFLIFLSKHVNISAITKFIDHQVSNQLDFDNQDGYKIKISGHGYDEGSSLEKVEVEEIIDADVPYEHDWYDTQEISG